MSYKTLVTVMRHKDRDTALLDAAATLAEAWGAHLDVLALGTDRLQPGAYYAGAAAVAIQTSMQDAIDDAKAAEAASRDALRLRDCPWAVMAAAAQIGAMGQIVARHGGLADMVVLPAPYGAGRTAEDVAVVEAALFSTRTPVMILPDGATPPVRPERVLLAWNQSAEALAAIRGSLPLLKTAKTVEITVIDPPEHDPDRSDPGGHLAEVLSRHGIHAEITVLSRTMPRISDVISRHVGETGADMVVMGAYGHSRFREAILGGATRNMLEGATIPVLMAH
ncbi:universal stress protein [Alphaproteobacteria bacterium GH1-50]|uniref:Universal stress protein n=1 Tax=Kangsaoukella pontilimi TaxID=2691042 RepID=A0A7C9IIP0_9RHOB|nr:universal stress protein [Kangsaoukella pontilimi]MXQ09449.1 universal stress protein [Kangsaoukella pontilimi]